MSKHKKKSSLSKKNEGSGAPRKLQTGRVKSSLRLEFGEKGAVDKLLQDARDAEQHEKREQFLVEALRHDPFHVDAMKEFAELRASEGRYNDAVVQLQRAFMLAPEDAELAARLTKVAGYAGQVTLAAYAARRWVKLNPQDRIALDVYAGLLGNLGFEAESIRMATESVRIAPLRRAKATGDEKLKIIVLMTKASGANRYNPHKAQSQISEGHNNLPGVLDTTHITKDFFYVDVLEDRPDEKKRLGQYDLVLNSITDPDRCRKALHRAETLCEFLEERDGVPIFNHPRQVLECTREAHARLASRYDQLIFPKAVSLGVLEGSIEEELRAAVEAHGFEMPVIVRAAGYQGGKHMHRLDDLESLKIRLDKPSEVQVIQYHEFGHTDDRIGGRRLYPKHRAMLVGDHLYPVHTLWSIDDFNVHRKNTLEAEEQYPFLVDEVRPYLEKPEEVIEGASWQQLKTMMKESGLAYTGIDFAVSTATGSMGRLIVFEMNPAMRNWIGSLPDTDLCQAAWVRVTGEIHRHICSLTGLVPWAFALPPASNQST